MTLSNIKYPANWATQKIARLQRCCQTLIAQGITLDFHTWKVLSDIVCQEDDAIGLGHLLALNRSPEFCEAALIQACTRKTRAEVPQAVQLSATATAANVGDRTVRHDVFAPALECVKLICSQDTYRPKTEPSTRFEDPNLNSASVLPLSYGAAYFNHTPLLDELLNAFPQDTRPNEVLAMACFGGALDTLNWCHTQRHFNLNVPLDTGDSLLHVASLHNQRDIVAYLLQNGVDATVVNPDGVLAEEIALRKGYFELYQQLRTHLNDQELIQSDNRPLLLFTRRLAMPNLVLDNRSVAITPLQHACQNLSCVEVQQLLEAGANPNGTCETSPQKPLLIAVQRQDIDTVQVLLDADAAITEDTLFQHQPYQSVVLIEACQYDHVALLNLLLKHAPEQAIKQDAARMLNTAAQHGQLNIINALLQRPAWHDNLCDAINSALKTAIQFNQTACIEHLSQHESCTFSPMDCLAAACASGHLSVFERYFDPQFSLAEMNAQHLLHLACASGQIDLIDRLLALGLNQNTENEQHRLPLLCTPKAMREAVQERFNQHATDATRALRQCVVTHSIEHPLAISIQVLARLNGLSADPAVQSRVDALYNMATELLTTQDGNKLNHLTEKMLISVCRIVDRLDDRLIFSAIQGIYTRQHGTEIIGSALSYLARNGCLHQLNHDITYNLTIAALSLFCKMHALERACSEDLRFLLEKGVSFSDDALESHPAANALIQQHLSDRKLFLTHYKQAIPSELGHHPELAEPIQRYLDAYIDSERLAMVLPALARLVKHLDITESDVQETVLSVLQPIADKTHWHPSHQALYNLLTLFNQLLNRVQPHRQFASAQPEEIHYRSLPFDHTLLEFACRYHFQHVLFTLIQHELGGRESLAKRAGALCHIADENKKPSLFLELVRRLPMATYYETRTANQPCVVTMAVPNTELLPHVLAALNGAGVDAQDLFGNTALHRACAQGHIQSCWMLFQHGWHFNKQNVKGITPLQSLSTASFKALMQLIIDQEPLSKVFLAKLFLACPQQQKNTFRAHYVALLKVAVQTKNDTTIRILIETAKKLLKQGDWNCVIDAMQLACEEGYLDVLECLREDSSTQQLIQLFQYQMFSALEHAAMRNQHEVLKWIQEKLPFLPPQSRSPLLVNCSEETKRKLIEMGESIPHNYPVTEELRQVNEMAQLKRRHAFNNTQLREYTQRHPDGELSRAIRLLRALLLEPNKANVDLLDAANNAIIWKDVTPLIKAANHFEAQRVGRARTAAVLYAVAAIACLLLSAACFTTFGFALSAQALHAVGLSYGASVTGTQTALIGGSALAGAAVCGYQAFRWFGVSQTSDEKAAADSVVALMGQVKA